MKTLTSALALTITLGAAAQAQTTTAHIGPMTVSLMPAPACVVGSDAVISGVHGSVYGPLKGNYVSPTGADITDPYAKWPALAGKAPYYALVGNGSGDRAVISYSFATPQTMWEQIWGTTDRDNWVSFVDVQADGTEVPVFQINGQTLAQRMSGHPFDYSDFVSFSLNHGHFNKVYEVSAVTAFEEEADPNTTCTAQ